ncbi:hypothetical protein V9N51_002962 [Vibrio cholerae]|uniref:hypothetical protein n=1 Tax=Vibrio cholerae TaxID=666 RepID=UPI0011D6CF42|nr:hypothetical protein [Vibrio cholerae]EGQ9320513.1 hypothetical protein [Vibrio cholerae]EGQ9645570.1 hypothetical protein [Vibrio cholerae]EJL6639515.1 hypothetical protein [Vibrio cholerae]TXZ51372.1 hypothetical protein FXE24_16815 [Vibrio cholerae]GHW12473.1 hypothetical protein VCSRO54_2310 [Vibrio cholerae]
MAFEIGRFTENKAASNHRDFIDKLRIFASKNGWVVKRWVKDVIQPTKPAEGIDELILQSNGESGQESIVVGFKTNFNATNDTYNILMWTSPLFSDGASFENQPEMSPIHVVYAWQNNMDYLICLDKDHIKFWLNVSAGNTSHVGYVGKLRSYCSLGHWPRQLVVFGEGSNQNGRWSDQGDAYSSFQFMRGNPRSVFWTDDKWWNNGGTTFPVQTSSALINSGANYNSGKAWMIQMMFLDNNKGAIGEFIGCFHINGDRLTNGTLLEDPLKTESWLVIQNIFRNGFNDYMAWELV